MTMVEFHMADVKRETLSIVPPASTLARIDAIDWARATDDLDAQGCAVLKRLLTPERVPRAGGALS